MRAVEQAVEGVCGSTSRLVEPSRLSLGSSPRCHRGPAAVTAGTLGGTLGLRTLPVSYRKETLPVSYWKGTLGGEDTTSEKQRTQKEMNTRD